MDLEKKREYIKQWREKNKDAVSDANKKFYNKYTKIYKRVGKYLKLNNKPLFDEIVAKLGLDRE